MKKLLFLIISILFTLPFGIITFAGNSEIIKVALNSQFGTVSSVEFSNSSIVFGCQNGNDFTGKTNVSGTVFSLKGCSGYYLYSDKTFSTYDEVKKSTYSVGVPTLEDDGKWRIYFGGYSSEADATSKKTDFAKYGVSSVVKTEKNAVALFCNGQIYAIFNGKDCLGTVKDAQGGNIIVNQKPYRGGITLCSNGSGYDVVNVIDVDEYLYGVLPVEMAVEWPREALKAQAVVARNFAIYSRNGKHANEPYDLCDSIHCQVYKGVFVEGENSNLAVDETKGVYIYYNGEIVETNFFASSGGYTADAYDVWGFESPYLKAVDDSDEKEGKVWTRSFSFSELTDIVRANGEDVGTVNNVFISSEDNNGRVNALVIEGTAGNITLEKEKIRTFFSKSSDGSLYSRNFSMSPNSTENKTVETNTKVFIMGNNSEDITELANLKSIDNKENSFDFSKLDKINVIGSSSTKAYDKITKTSVTVGNSSDNAFTPVSGDVVFYGKGMGHGVGMSQYGAKALAEKGFNYVDILKHYYTGIDVK